MIGHQRERQRDREREREREREKEREGGEGGGTLLIEEVFCHAALLKLPLLVSNCSIFDELFNRVN